MGGPVSLVTALQGSAFPECMKMHLKSITYMVANDGDE